MEVVALSLTVLVHFIGLGALVFVLLRNDGVDWRSWWPDDEDGRGGPEDPPGPTGPPLDAAAPGRTRLREDGRLADAYPPAARRPAHAPERERVSVP